MRYFVGGEPFLVYKIFSSWSFWAQSCLYPNLTHTHTHTFKAEMLPEVRILFLWVLQSLQLPCRVLPMLHTELQQCLQM